MVVYVSVVGIRTPNLSDKGLLTRLLDLNVCLQPNIWSNFYQGQAFKLTSSMSGEIILPATTTTTTRQDKIFCFVPNYDVPVQTKRLVLQKVDFFILFKYPIRLNDKRSNLQVDDDDNDDIKESAAQLFDCYVEA